MTRCAALKNPCAIRRGSAWKGLSTFQHDREFCEFTDVVFGIRAFFVLMRTYHYKYKCYTVKDIISRYAPITENDTPSYIAFVLKSIREQLITHAKKYDLHSLSYDYLSERIVVNTWYNSKSPSMWLRLLCKAVCRLESKYDVSDELIDAAIKLL